MLMRKSSRLGFTALQVIIVIVAVIAVGLAIFWYVTDKNSNDQATGKNGGVTASSSDLTVTSSSPRYTFKELGIQVGLPPLISKLSYTVSRPPATVPDKSLFFTRLQLDKYTELANRCFKLKASTPQYFANLVKSAGSAGTTNPNAQVLKQFKDYYISDIGASIGSAAKCTDPSVQQDLKTMNANLNKALVNAFQTAQEVKG
jgi:hypothetical protein